MKFPMPSPNATRPLPPFIAPFLLWLGHVSPLCASDRYLEPGHLDSIALLAPPRASGSEEEAADLQMCREVFKARTSTLGQTRIANLIENRP